MGISRFNNTSAIILLVLTMMFTSCSTKPTNEQELENDSPITKINPTKLSPIEFAYNEMIVAGISPTFAKRLENQYIRDKKSTSARDKIVQLNVLGFLTPGDYSKHYSVHAVKQIKKFLKKYNSILVKAEKDFQVPKEIIASLLWVETKHGKSMGNFQLPLVYFSLLQANHPDVASNVLSELNVRKPASNSSAAKLTFPELKQKVISRLNSKSKLALSEIKALEDITNSQKLNTHQSRSVFKIQSSFAGAFGCSQFLPSSYQKYASSNSKNIPNLFDLKDCIYSVGNFLSKSGWNTQDPKAQSDALFEYNRIRDYGAVIQKLAEAAKHS